PDGIDGDIDRPGAHGRSVSEAGALKVAPALLFAGLLAYGGMAAFANELHSERSLYRNIIVYEEDGIRCMKFGRQAAGRQTCQSQTDRDRLVFDYTRMMMAALYMNPSPQRILIIGLGGGTLPRTLQKILPTARIDA